MPDTSPYGWKDLLTDAAIVALVAGLILLIIGYFPDFFGKFLPLFK